MYCLTVLCFCYLSVCSLIAPYGWLTFIVLLYCAVRLVNFQNGCLTGFCARITFNMLNFRAPRLVNLRALPYSIMWPVTFLMLTYPILWLCLVYFLCCSKHVHCRLDNFINQCHLHFVGSVETYNGVILVIKSKNKTKKKRNYSCEVDLRTCMYFAYNINAIIIADPNLFTHVFSFFNVPY